MQDKQPQVLYTPEQRARRDATKWTLVQGLLAPVQFLIFLVSLYLVLNSLQTGEHTDWALAYFAVLDINSLTIAKIDSVKLVGIRGKGLGKINSNLNCSANCFVIRT